MDKINIFLGASALLFSSILNATIIHYSITGDAYYGAPEEWHTAPLVEITGDAYISDEGKYLGYGDAYFYDIDSFTLVIGDYGYGGYGEMGSSHGGTSIYLQGSGGWFPGNDGTNWQSWKEEFEVFPQLPETYNFNNGFNYTESIDGKFFALINNFIITEVASVPEPSVLALMSVGLIGLIGLARRKSRI